LTALRRGEDDDIPAQPELHAVVLAPSGAANPWPSAVVPADPG
jgi:hypothetical protein